MLLVSKTWIYQNCQLILLFFLLYISLNTLPISSSHVTSFNQYWLTTLSHCPFCMSPNSNLLIYLFFSSFFKYLLWVAVTNFRYLFFSFSDATRGSAVKRFSISFARHPTNGTFCFYFKRYSPASSFFIFLLFQNVGYTVSFISPFVISVGIQFQLMHPKYWYCLTTFLSRNWHNNLTLLIRLLNDHMMMSFNNKLAPENSL